MQTRFHLPMFFFMAAIILFSSCSKTNKTGRYIPKTAAVALVLNGESLSSKLPWDEIRQNELFKNLYADSTLEAYIKAALDNPENTGISTKKDLLFFVQKDSIGGYIALQGSINDAAKFKSFNSSLTKSTAETEKDGVHTLSNEKMTASWDKDKFVILVDAPQLNDANKFSNGLDSRSEAQPLTRRDIIGASRGIFSLKENNSLGKDEKFTDLVNDKADIHFWINASGLSSGSMGMAALSMLNMSKLTEGAIMSGTADFENGRINIDMKSYAGKEISEIWKKYGGSKIDKEMIKRIPANDIAVLFALSFKPEGIREFIKLAGLEGFANMGTASIGITMDDFIKANHGDILFSLSDLNKDSMGLVPNMLFSASIEDKNSFNKLIDAGNRVGREKFGSGTTPMAHYNKNDKYFVIGSKKESVDKYISSASNNNMDMLDKISGTPTAIYLNFQLLLGGLKTNISSADSLDNIAYNTTLNMWQNLISTGGEYKDGGITQHVEINLVNKNINSLKQLNNYLGVLGGIQKQKKLNREKMMKESWGTEEDFMAPPAPVEDTPMPVQ